MTMTTAAAVHAGTAVARSARPGESSGLPSLPRSNVDAARCPPCGARPPRNCRYQSILRCHVSHTVRPDLAPPLLEVSADNWRLAILVGLVVSVLAALALPASVSFWIVGAMVALVAAAFVVNAYRRRYYGGLLVAPAIAVLFVMNIFPLLWSLGLVVLCLPVEPAVHPLRRPQQLHQGPDQRHRGAGHLARPR